MVRVSELKGGEDRAMVGPVTRPGGAVQQVLMKGGRGKDEVNS